MMLIFFFGALSRLCAVALTSQLCLSPGCGKHAAYGDSLDRRAIFCVSHKLNNHINLKNPTCQTPGCSRGCPPRMREWAHS